MSDEARNVAILTEAYRRWSDSKGASADHWISICDQNIRFGSIAEPLKAVAYMGSYRSRDELGQYFAGLTRDWEMLDYRVDHFVAQGDRVVMLGHCSWRAKGERAGGVDAESRLLAVRRRQGGRVLRVLRHRAGMQAMAPA